MRICLFMRKIEAGGFYARLQKNGQGNSLVNCVQLKIYLLCNHRCNRVVAMSSKCFNTFLVITTSKGFTLLCRGQRGKKRK